MVILNSNILYVAWEENLGSSKLLPYFHTKTGRMRAPTEFRILRNTNTSCLNCATEFLINLKPLHRLPPSQTNRKRSDAHSGKLQFFPKTIRTNWPPNRIPYTYRPYNKLAWLFRHVPIEVSCFAAVLRIRRGQSKEQPNSYQLLFSGDLFPPPVLNRPNQTVPFYLPSLRYKPTESRYQLS